MATTVKKDYKQAATNQYDPAYQARVTGLKNALASNLLSLESSKTGINSNYDTSVASSNLNNTRGKNNLSNTMLGRGLGTSSIVTSGLAEQDQINSRQVGQINKARLGDLNNVDAQKALLNQNTTNDLNTMAGTRLSEIQALADRLQQVDVTNEFTNRGLEMQQQGLDMNKQNQTFTQGMTTKNYEMARQSRAFDEQYKNRSLASQEAQYQQDLAFRNKSLADAREQNRIDNEYRSGQLDDGAKNSIAGIEGMMRKQDGEEYESVDGKMYNASRSNKLGTLSKLRDRYSGLNTNSAKAVTQYINNVLNSMYSQGE